MEPRLIQKQTQKLVLSPQMRQYLRLLQLPVMDLAQAVEAELSENPLLDEKQDGPAEDEESLSERLPEETPERTSEEIKIGDSYEKLNRLDEAYPEEFPAYDYSIRKPSDAQKMKDFQETLITRPEALSDYLLWQIRFLPLSPLQEKIAEEIIGNLNEQGYLQASLEEIASACGCGTQEAEEVLVKIHELEPPGIGARSLQEALLIQLRRRHPSHELALKITRDHLSLLEKRDWQQIARLLNADVTEVKEAAALISRLEPRPGRSFYAEEPIAVTPDAVITQDESEDMGHRIEITDEKIPALRINTYYRRLLRDKGLDEQGRTFLRNKLQDAMEFIKAIQQRRSTLRDITQEIMREQPDFLEKGFAYLKPLRLKDIAYNLQIHESTVSRAIQGKYVQTPQGTIPYKSFFSSKLETSSGQARSQRSIMLKVKDMVEKENPTRPLSDQEIVERLKAEGVIIARRTVAKYRDILKILPSHLRRRK